MERPSETCTVLFQSKIILRYCASGWFTIVIYYDAWSYKCQRIFSHSHAQTNVLLHNYHYESHPIHLSSFIYLFTFNVSGADTNKWNMNQVIWTFPTVQLITGNQSHWIQQIMTKHFGCSHFYQINR
jgi:hypothetical protein